MYSPEETRHTPATGLSTYPKITVVRRSFVRSARSFSTIVLRSMRCLILANDYEYLGDHGTANIYSLK